MNAYKHESSCVTSVYFFFSHPILWPTFVLDFQQQSTTWINKGTYLYRQKMDTHWTWTQSLHSFNTQCLFSLPSSYVTNIKLKFSWHSKSYWCWPTQWSHTFRYSQSSRPILPQWFQTCITLRNYWIHLCCSWWCIHCLSPASILNSYTFVHLVQAPVPTSWVSTTRQNSSSKKSCPSRIWTGFVASWSRTLSHQSWYHEPFRCPPKR